MIETLSFCIAVSETEQIPYFWFCPKEVYTVFKAWDIEMNNVKAITELLSKIEAAKNAQPLDDKRIITSNYQVYFKNPELLIFQAVDADKYPTIEVEYCDLIEFLEKYRDWLTKYENGLIPGLTPLPKSFSENSEELPSTKSRNIYDIRFVYIVSPFGQYPGFRFLPEEISNVVSNWTTEYRRSKHVEELLSYIRQLNTFEVPTKERIESNECKIHLKARGVLTFDIEYATELAPVDMDYDDAIELFTKYRDWLDRYERGLIPGLQPVSR
jgi:hypothetical protein